MADKKTDDHNTDGNIALDERVKTKTVTVSCIDVE